MTTPKLTEKAIEQIKKVLTENSMDAEKTYVRVGVRYSCSGPAYAFGFDDEYLDEVDALNVQDGLKIVNQKEFSDHLSLIEIDYVDNEKKGFTFRNTDPSSLPVLEGGCGSGGCCGGGGCQST